LYLQIIVYTIFMIEFSVLKKSKKSAARLGVLKTPHGEVMTPAIVPVATLAAVKALRSDEIAATGTQLLISNTYHLHLQPGEKIVKAAGGINKFMNWQKPSMTDSGGFQVFSLGFGRDLGVGKNSIKYYPGKLEKAIEKGHQPNHVRMTEDGVHFRSPLTGEELFLSPETSIAIQQQIGADIMFAFDECPPPGATHEYMKQSLARTHRWAKRSLTARTSKQALYGIVQGADFEDLRKEGAKFITRQDFDGFAIGGDIGESKDESKKILKWVLPLLDQKLPRHLLGIGHPEDIELIIKGGVDTFDCTVPTHYARRGIAFVNKKSAPRGSAHEGRVDFNKAALLKDKGPIDPTCECVVCQKYQRAYIAHLIRANEITGGALLTFHNLFFFNTYVAKMREKIAKGLL
jgi:queuine tRNA-ribosyltransferase/7-cyano-7-deazaguanine tRNA-ribosyltransferase